MQLLPTGEHALEDVAAIVDALDHSAISKTSASASPVSKASSTSSHPTGVDTVGRSFARIEQAHTINLCSVFWLHSMSTFPARSDLAMRDTTASGVAASSSSATALLRGFVSA
jgi:hypothetical protein